jgi:hypothetical protein
MTAWTRLQAITTLKLEGDFEPSIMGERAYRALAQEKHAIDFGMDGHTLFTRLEFDTEERFDPVAMADIHEKDDEEFEYADDFDAEYATHRLMIRSLRTHPYRIARQKMKLEQVCHAILKSRPYVQSLIHHELRTRSHYSICYSQKHCVWKTPKEVQAVDREAQKILDEVMREIDEEEISNLFGSHAHDGEL